MFNSMFQNVSGQTNSTVAELSKFNMRAANEHYKVKKEDSLEAILLALHLPGDEVAFNFSLTSHWTCSSSLISRRR